MAFGQIVLGPAGSGKTTYCKSLASAYTQLSRQTIIVNLDPANDLLPYIPAINITSLISMYDVMEKLKLGPNGAMMYCMEYLEKNMDWLLDALAKHHPNTYILFDCPGQVELFTHHSSLKNIIDMLTKHNINVRIPHPQKLTTH